MKIDLERREAESALMPSEFIVEMCSIPVSNARGKFLAMPNAVKSRFPTPELSIINDIDDKIRDRLTELAGTGEDYPRG